MAMSAISMIVSALVLDTPTRPARKTNEAS